MALHISPSPPPLPFFYSPAYFRNSAVSPASRAFAVHTITPASCTKIFIVPDEVTRGCRARMGNEPASAPTGKPVLRFYPFSPVFPPFSPVFPPRNRLSCECAEQIDAVFAADMKFPAGSNGSTTFNLSRIRCSLNTRKSAIFDRC